MPSARSIITIAIVSALTSLAIEHFRASGGVAGTRARVRNLSAA